jgi:hypothetical protein
MTGAQKADVDWFFKNNPEFNQHWLDCGYSRAAYEAAKKDYLEGSGSSYVRRLPGRKGAEIQISPMSAMAILLCASFALILSSKIAKAEWIRLVMFVLGAAVYAVGSEIGVRSCILHYRKQDSIAARAKNHDPYTTRM